MKSILIIGLGRFGRHLCRKFMSLDNEVMIVDRDEAAVSALADEVTSAQIADCTDENALRALGVKNFDLCFVCIGSDFASSLLITSMLKEMGAARVVAKAARDVHAKLLLRNGADHVVYAEREMAERLAIKYGSKNIFDYIELTPEYAIYEIAVPASWIGKSILEKGIRTRYGISILATKKGSKIFPQPHPDHIFSADETLMVMGNRQDIKAITR